MVIGIDAGALSVSDQRLKVGVYRIIVNLLRELSEIDTENEYRLYSFQSLHSSITSVLSDRMRSIVLRPKRAWFTFRLPFSLFVHPVDMFLGVSQAVPFGNHTNIGFIYDVGFLHHPEAYPGSKERLMVQTQHVVNHSKHIITISEASKKDICAAYHVSTDMITVAYPGVDDIFNEKGKAFQYEKPYILHVGSLKPGKNIPVLIRAFSEFLKSSKQEYTLLLIGGDYWMDERIHDTIQSEHIEHAVRLLGYVPDDILAEYYRGASAFVSTSLSEGFCLPVMEAMASGCPVITSSIGAFPEIVPEETLLFEPDDIHGFAHGIKTITEDKEFRNIVIAKGLTESKRYQWKSFAQTVYTTIQNMK